MPPQTKRPTGSRRSGVVAIVETTSPIPVKSQEKTVFKESRLPVTLSIEISSYLKKVLNIVISERKTTPIVRIRIKAQTIGTITG
jgi:hypothetical protein